MSIFASLATLSDDQHSDECARWDKRESGGGEIWELSDRSCDCGQLDAPLVYQGSHILPTELDERGGYVDIALIPAHVRYWRENPDAPSETEPESPPEPFLRFGVNESRVILTRHHVEGIVRELQWWLEATA